MWANEALYGAIEEISSFKKAMKKQFCKIFKKYDRTVDDNFKWILMVEKVEISFKFQDVNCRGSSF